jgi:hypothetical protein
MEIGAAMNVYKAKRDAYAVACIPTTPDKAGSCWRWRDGLADCYARIGAATKAAKLGDAKPQLDAMEKACDGAPSALPEMP